MATAKKEMSGIYAQKVVLSGLLETAANTLTFDKVETGMSVYDQIGWVLSRVEYRLTANTRSLFNGTGDNLSIALVSTNTLTLLGDANPAIYALRSFTRIDFGTAASATLESNTYVDDYSGLPGGGLLLLPNPLYGAIVGTGLSGPAFVSVILYVQPVQLDKDDYFNLVQARQLLINS